MTTEEIFMAEAGRGQQITKLKMTAFCDRLHHGTVTLMMEAVRLYYFYETTRRFSPPSEPEISQYTNSLTA
jgi:hypothetical protein